MNADRTVAGSDAIEWPKDVQAPKGAPNVLIVMTDDVGFGATEVFGGPVSTPTYARLAKNGLRYNRFHTTALCSPTRAALLTGRNHHVASTGIIMEFSTPFPGYHSIVSKSVGTLGEILTGNGYGSAWFGKNHNHTGRDNLQIAGGSERHRLLHVSSRGRGDACRRSQVVEIGVESRLRRTGFAAVRQ